MNSTPNLEHLKSGNEIVFTVTDYYDGPRQGIANYQGTPHFYECIFDSATNDYSDLYRLTALDELVFRLALEKWEIWRRWELAFHTGKTNMESHPALPEDAARHEELEQLLGNALQSSPSAITRVGKFSALGHSELPPGMLRQLQVRWTNP